MRLSDEDVSVEREAALLRMAQGHRSNGEPVTRVTRDLLAAYCEQMAALIAEVRALRECERALELLIGRIPPDADPFESGDLWIGASGIIAARSALAAVRALEDKPMTLGTCSICGGPVAVPDVWWGVVPPSPRCGSCGAVPRDPYGPEIPMKPHESLSITTSDLRGKP